MKILEGINLRVAAKLRNSRILFRLERRDLDAIRGRGNGRSRRKAKCETERRQARQSKAR